MPLSTGIGFCSKGLNIKCLPVCFILIILTGRIVMQAEYTGIINNTSPSTARPESKPGSKPERTIVHIIACYF